MVFIGIDLGGTKITAAIFSGNGLILSQESILLHHRTGSQVGKLIIKIIQNLLEINNIREAEKKSIGVCVPGIAYSKTGNVWAPNIPGWENYPLQNEIEHSIPNSFVIIESDRTCYILGETNMGSARGCNNAVFMAVGTGIGLGILIDGMVLHGNSDIVGAVGWMALKPPYNAFYDKCGCFETHASGDGIATQAKKAIQETPGYQGDLKLIDLEEITSYHVFEAFHNHDPLAVKIIGQAVEMWGMAAANIVSLFNPEMLIFGGGVFGPATMLIDRIYAEACKWAQPISIREVKFTATTLPKLAGLYGAGAIAIKNAKAISASVHYYGD